MQVATINDLGKSMCSGNIPHGGSMRLSCAYESQNACSVAQQEVKDPNCLQGEMSHHSGTKTGGGGGKPCGCRMRLGSSAFKHIQQGFTPSWCWSNVHRKASQSCMLAAISRTANSL